MRQFAKARHVLWPERFTREAFAFADDGLRERDERRIPSQERANAELEAKAAAPIEVAVLESKGMLLLRTDVVSYSKEDTRNERSAGLSNVFLAVGFIFSEERVLIRLNAGIEVGSSTKNSVR